MQPYKFDDIIKKKCDEKGLDPVLMKSITNDIFSRTKKEMFEFNDLSIYITGMVAFYYGKKRLENFKLKIEERLAGDTSRTMNFIEERTEEELRVILEKVERLLSRYDEYITEKKTIKGAYKAKKLQQNELDSKV